MSDRKFSMPDMSYTMRETVIEALLMRKYQLESLIETTTSDEFRNGYVNNLTEVIAAYDTIQHHF